MLQGRLTSVVALFASVLLASCTGSGGAIRDNVIEPGITAIDQANELQCSQDASNLRTALQAYEMLEGKPAATEQDLIDGEYLREASDVWDVVDGELVATDPGCGDVPATIPVSEIVTSTEPPLTPDQVLVGFTDEQIDAVGGIECARELAAIFSAVDQYVVDTGIEPADFADLVDSGALAEAPTLWTTTGDELVPVDGSGCVDVGQ